MRAANLFVYGTLRDPELVRESTGKTFVTDEATLLDYERRELPDTYAFVVPQPGGRVPGLVLRDVDLASLQAFDVYEGVGTLYERRLAVVATVAGREDAFVYVPQPGRLPYRAHAHDNSA